MIIWIVIIVLVIVLISLFVTKSSYFEVTPSLKNVATYHDALAKAAELRQSAYVHEAKRAAAELREADAIRSMRRESAIKAAEESESRMLIAAAEAHEQLAAAQREQSKRIRESNKIAEYDAEAEKSEAEAEAEAAAQVYPHKRRTQLIPSLILSQANFPSPMTNCVGNRGNSLLLPQ